MHEMFIIWEADDLALEEKWGGNGYSGTDNVLYLFFWLELIIVIIILLA